MNTPQLPDKQYDIIYADPPWDYGGSRRMPVREKDAKYPSSPHHYYPVLSFDALKEIPIQNISNDNCLLFLWVCSPLMPRSIEVAEHWGFDYKTIAFVWDKQIPNAGFYTLSQVEVCLVLKKGKIPQPRGARNIKQFLSERRTQHSKKPNEVRKRITEMFPEQSKIELFARERFDGWDAWGNEV